MGNLYEKEFDEKLGEATELDYRSLQWTDADVVKLCGAIATGKLVKLENSTSSATRLATPALPRSRRWRASCRSSALFLRTTRLATPAVKLAEAAGKLPAAQEPGVCRRLDLARRGRAALPNCDVALNLKPARF